jgi:hypothetical protein
MMKTTYPSTFLPHPRTGAPSVFFMVSSITQLELGEFGKPPQRSLFLTETRFDNGDESLKDTKYIRLNQSIEYIVQRQYTQLGRLLGEFSFVYASNGITHGPIVKVCS